MQQKKYMYPSSVIGNIFAKRKEMKLLRISGKEWKGSIQRVERVVQCPLKTLTDLAQVEIWSMIFTQSYKGAGFHWEASLKHRPRGFSNQMTRHRSGWGGQNCITSRMVGMLFLSPQRLLESKDLIIEDPKLMKHFKKILMPAISYNSGWSI